MQSHLGHREGQGLHLGTNGAGGSMALSVLFIHLPLEAVGPAVRKSPHGEPCWLPIPGVAGGEIMVTMASGPVSEQVIAC